MDKELTVFKEAVEAAKKTALRSNKAVVVGGDNVQTKADVLAQEAIIEMLKKNGISCKLYSEELEEPLILGDGKYDIVIDPFDGSFLFLHGVQAFASIAMIVLENRKVKYALVQSIADDNLYHCDGTNAYLNGKKIICDTATVLEPYLIAGYAAKKHLLPWISKVEKLSPNFHFLNYGGSLLASMVGSNNVDANIEFTPVALHEFAGAIIAQKAGAFVETIEGGPLVLDPSLKQSLIVAGSKKLLQELQSVLR